MSVTRGIILFTDIINEQQLDQLRSQRHTVEQWNLVNCCADFPQKIWKVPYYKGDATSVSGFGVTGGSLLGTFKQVYRADLTGF